MQCSQPLFCPGFQTNVQFPPFIAQPCYPDVIGEGDVMTYTLPDGSVQCYFVPTARRELWTPHCSASYYVPSNLPTNKEAWFVRSILNTYPAAGVNQLPNNYGETFIRSTVTSPSYSFVQKFHNDGWTSTTDLHYFFPSLCREWSKGCAGIQVEIPKTEKTIFHYGTVCHSPCYCNHKIEIAKVASRTETPMCIDEVKSSHSCCSDSNKRGKKAKSSSKNKRHTCSCSRVEKSDKAVVTSVDRGISCCESRDNCQCSKRRTEERTDIATEVWYPRKRKPKRSNARCTVLTVNSAAASDSACCLGSVCSDNEQFANS